MSALLTTAILKTDISGSTVRFRSLAEADLHALLLEHRAFLGRHAAAHGGRIVKPEGDGFWLVFPSVTAAALAAMVMQEELRLGQPNRAGDRVAMRTVITLGDVLHEEGALVGDAVVLAARIEAITPPDEIFLSAAAWLALNQAEVRSALVDAYQLKGFPAPVPVYRVEQTHRTRVLANQCIVYTDLRGFTAIVDGAQITVVERILDALLRLAEKVCRDHGGSIRFNSGDSYCLTFDAAGAAIAAARELARDWTTFVSGQAQRCAINIALHHGTIHAFRSYLYGAGINIAGGLEAASAATLPQGEGGIFVSGEFRRELEGTEWHVRLALVEAKLRRFPQIEVYRLREPASGDTVA